MKILQRLLGMMLLLVLAGCGKPSESESGTQPTPTAQPKKIRLAYVTNGIDPLLMDISLPDLHIQGNSPAKNAGVVISAAINGSTDIDGNPRIVNNKINIGAQQ